MPVSKHKKFLNVLQAPLKAYEKGILQQHSKPSSQEDDSSSDCQSEVMQELEKKLDILFGTLADD